MWLADIRAAIHFYHNISCGGSGYDRDDFCYYFSAIESKKRYNLTANGLHVSSSRKYEVRAFSHLEEEAVTPAVERTGGDASEEAFLETTAREVRV